MKQGQANKDIFYSGKFSGFESMRKPEDELHEQEKARFERMKRDEEVFALKHLQNERVTRLLNDRYLT